MSLDADHATVFGKYPLAVMVSAPDGRYRIVHFYEDGDRLLLSEDAKTERGAWKSAATKIRRREAWELANRCEVGDEQYVDETF